LTPAFELLFFTLLCYWTLLQLYRNCACPEQPSLPKNMIP
jgi:hypothetical protein